MEAVGADVSVGDDQCRAIAFWRAKPGRDGMAWQNSSNCSPASAPHGNESLEPGTKIFESLPKDSARHAPKTI
jgi:hypothetical protein